MHASRAGCMSTSAVGICSRSCAMRSRAVADKVKLPPGYSISWSGQFEFLERAQKRLKAVVPFTLVIIFVLLYLTFQRVRRSTAHHARRAVRADRRLLADVAARLQLVDCLRCRVHRAGRRRGRVRRDHAAVSQAGDREATGRDGGKHGGAVAAAHRWKVRCCGCDPRR